MLVYEKKVDGTKHLYGKVEGTVPAVDDVQLTYKDAEGNTLTIQEKDTYKDNGKGGIYRVSDKKAVNVFIGDTQIIGEEIEESDTPLITSITVTPPTKTSYVEGDTLDLTGMVVTANFDNGDTEVLTEGFTATPTGGSTLTTSNNKVVIMYYELTDEFTITVEAATPTVTPTSIEVTTPPTKTVYNQGEELDLTGMVVTITGTDGTQEVTETLGYNEYTTSPEAGAVLTTDVTEVVVSAYDLEDSFTITVNA